MPHAIPQTHSAFYPHRSSASLDLKVPIVWLVSRGVDFLLSRLYPWATFFIIIIIFFMAEFLIFFLQCIEVVPDMTEERVAKMMETATRDAAAA